MTAHDFLLGAVVGITSGITSGLFGISPGGGLVLFSAMILGVDQHVAQGTSLLVQIPPTGLGGVRHYANAGRRSPLRWLVLLACGYFAGGLFGAWSTALVGDRTLRWAFVGYLVLLDAVLILRMLRSSGGDRTGAASIDLRWFSLLAVGLVAGFSSGFLGIGGGLATTVGLAALGVAQHQAQLVSLALLLVPTTAPSALVYWRDGLIASWPAIAGIIAGLVLGTDLGARIANRMSGERLRSGSIIFIAIMALAMAMKALK